MVSNKDMVDVRSTGRRRARRTLFESYTSFECVGYTNQGISVPCGKTTSVPPKDAPPWFEEIWPEDQRELTTLHADHESKDLENNDLQFLNWRCPSCHKKQDRQTIKGTATVTKRTVW